MNTLHINNPFLLAAVQVPKDLTSFLITLFIIVLVCGLLALLVNKSPLEAPWKGILNWLLICIPVAYIILWLLQFIR